MTGMARLSRPPLPALWPLSGKPDTGADIAE